MPSANETETGLWCLVGIAGAFLLIVLSVGAVAFFNDFSRRLRYLNNEIKRTDGIERRYWIREKRRLWLSLIPFIKY